MRVLNPQTHRYWDWLPDVKWNIYRSGDFGKCRHFTWFSFLPTLLLWYEKLLPSPLSLDEGRGEAPELAWAEWPLGGEGGLASWGPWPEPLFWEPSTEPPRHGWTPFCVSLWNPLVPSSRLIAVYFQLLTSQNHPLLENKLSCSSLTTPSLAKRPAHSNSTTIV